MKWLRTPAFFVVILILAAVVLGTQSPSRAATDPNTDGLRSISTCVQSGRSLSVLFLFDGSGSLADTDPSNLRYEGLRAGLGALARTADRRGADFPVDVAVAEFSDGYRSLDSVVDWTGLRTSSPDERQQVIDKIVQDAEANTSDGGGTNFQSALSGTLDDLKDRSGKGNCRVVLWFTDGLDDDASHLQEICRVGGIADELRKQRIPVVALHLTNASQGVGAGDLPRIAYGKSGGQACGTYPLPEGSSAGIYLDASDPTALVQIFNGLGNIVQGCTPTGALGKVIEPGIRRVSISFASGGDVKSVRLLGPGGEDIVAPGNGAFEQDGYRTEAQQQDGFVELMLTPPAGQGIGAWQVVTSPAVQDALITWCVFSDVSLQVDKSSPVPNAGMKSTLNVQAVDPEGNPVNLAEYAQAVPSVVASNAKGQRVKSSVSVADPQKGLLAVSVTPGLTDPRMDMALKLDLTTTGGLALSPVVDNFPLTVKLSKDFPVVIPSDELNLTDVVRKQPSTGQLQLIGSPEGPTQVCFDAVRDLVVPAKAEGSTLDYQQGCIDLAASETRFVDVIVNPKDSAEGAASANIPIKLVAVPRNGKSAEAEMLLPAVWRFTTPFGVIGWWLLIGSVALAVLLPILAAFLANWLTARFDVTALTHAGVPVVIEDGQVSRRVAMKREPSLLFDLAEIQSVFVAEAKKSHLPGLWGRRLARRFSSDQGTVFSVIGALRPFRGTTFVVSVPDGYRILTQYGEVFLTPGRFRRAELPPRGQIGLARPAFNNFWLFVGSTTDIQQALVDKQEGRRWRVEGTLHLFNGGPVLDASQMSNKVRSEGPWDQLPDLLGGDSVATARTPSETQGPASMLDKYEPMDTQGPAPGGTRNWIDE